MKVTIQKMEEGFTTFKEQGHFEGWLVRGLIDGRIQVLSKAGAIVSMRFTKNILAHLRTLGDAQAIQFFLQATIWPETPLEVVQAIVSLL